MNKILITFVIIAATAAIAAHADPRITYVGDGRYTCTGSGTACSQVDANNRQREAERSYQDQRERERAQDYVADERRREQARRRNDQGQP